MDILTQIFYFGALSAQQPLAHSYYLSFSGGTLLRYQCLKLYLIAESIIILSFRRWVFFCQLALM